LAQRLALEAGEVGEGRSSNGRAFLSYHLDVELNRRQAEIANFARRVHPEMAREAKAAHL
jgi:hypothetical protein